jgi:hypothetical protein
LFAECPLGDARQTWGAVMELSSASRIDTWLVICRVYVCIVAKYPIFGEVFLGNTRHLLKFAEYDLFAAGDRTLAGCVHYSVLKVA